MGWSSWYANEVGVNEKDIRRAADWLVQSGLASHGHQYINLDDGWQGKRNQHGELEPNVKFGDMKKLADSIYGKGLRFGIYSSPGPKSCGGYEGSFGHEKQGAKTFAACAGEPGGPMRSAS
jgi:alpha-galactosidase